MTNNNVVHVCFGDDNHHYFGSIAAIFDKFSPEQLGVSKSRLWSYGLSPERPYRNDKCIIYRDELHRKKGKKQK